MWPKSMTDSVLTGCIFFSSRRRHTRYWRDWSSDVCSSDLRDLALRHTQDLGRTARHEEGGQTARADASSGKEDRRASDPTCRSRGQPEGGLSWFSAHPRVRILKRPDPTCACSDSPLPDECPRTTGSVAAAGLTSWFGPLP